MRLTPWNGGSSPQDTGGGGGHRVPSTQSQSKDERSSGTSKEVFSKTVARFKEAQRLVLLHLTANTGMHFSETHRLANGQGAIEGDTLTIFHKNGRQDRIEVTLETAAIANQVMESGGVSRFRFTKAVPQACKDAKVTP